MSDRTRFILQAAALIGASAVLGDARADEAAFLLKPGAEWKYYTGAERLEQGWYKNHAELLVTGEGAAPLGYRYDDIATQIPERGDFVLPFSGGQPGRHPAAFFARGFFVDRDALPEGQSAITAFVSCDDGCIAYVNGEEIGRIRLSEGAVQDYSAEGIGKVMGFAPLAIPVSLLRDGANDIAVEVHQQHPESSDLKFDAAITPANPDFIPR